jgi:DNA-damage-inducible protein D
MDEENKLVVFQEKGIRRIWHNEEWHFSVSDIVGVLSESADSKAYWRKLKQREPELVTICHGLKIPAKDGKMRKEDCSNTEGMFRIIQSVPSPKAEPFKKWLAKVGYERIQEIENPELAAERARQYYQDLGYSDDWIAKRLQSIDVRGKLTDEWKKRDVKLGAEYSILTAEISRATFGMTPSEYKGFKDLKRENLRDHMTDLELIFTMLGETATRNDAEENDAKGFSENKKSAIEGGAAAGDALEAFEKRTGKQVISDKNFKHQIEEAKKQKKLDKKVKEQKDK